MGECGGVGGWVEGETGGKVGLFLEVAGYWEGGRGILLICWCGGEVSLRERGIKWGGLEYMG